MLADLLSHDEKFMQGVQLYQGVGQQDQGREKEVIEITEKANFLHWLRFQQERCLPVYEEEYCIGKVGEEEERKGNEWDVGADREGSGDGEQESGHTQDEGV